MSSNSRSEFLDHLSDSSFGKIICINLYRSASLGTLSDLTIREFLDQCQKQFQAERLTAGRPDTDVALKVSKDWLTRKPLMKTAEFPSPPSNDDPIQFVTVIPCEKIEKMTTLAKTGTYRGRKIQSQKDLEIVVQQWAKGDSVWKFGDGLNYFWIARPLDTSALPSHRLAHGTAQLHRDTLGLCHYGNSNRLVRAMIPAALATTASPLLRPTALDGIDNPAFLAARDNEFPGPANQAGTTLDLHFLSDPTSLYGVHEWLCKPLQVAAGNVVWDYLGTPPVVACANDSLFHNHVLSQLERKTPILDALKYLKSIA